jgi:glycosyltransferase involved in cell wall biosynthesis
MTASPSYTISYINSLPKFDRSVSVLCWAYNEELLIEEFLVRANELLEQYVDDFEIIVVEDGSTDGTRAIIERLIPLYPAIKLLANGRNMNIAYSFKRAINAASKEYLFWQTIDWSYNIQCLRQFLEFLKSYDIVSGVRRAPVKVNIKLIKPIALLLKLFGIKELTKRSDTIPKAIISIFNYMLVRFLFNFPLSDYQNLGFYPSKLIKSIKIEANSSFGNPELLLKAHWRGCSIIEVPISFIPRKAGEAKGTRLKSLIASVKDIFRLWFNWIILRKRELIKKGVITRLKPSEWEII